MVNCNVLVVNFGLVEVDVDVDGQRGVGVGGSELGIR